MSEINEMSVNQLLANIQKEFGSKFKKFVEDTCVKGSSKTKIVDPTKPKKVSPFFNYSKVKREEVAKSNPELKPKEISKKLGEMWKELSDDSKKQFYVS